MNNRDKFLKLVSKEDTKTLENIKWRKENRDWLKKSQAIALQILKTLRKNNMSQKDLAERLEVSPQQVNKWLKGKENFRLETISKIERALNIHLVEVCNMSIPSKYVLEENISFEIIVNPSLTSSQVKFEKTNKESSKIIEMRTDNYEYQVAGY